MTARKAPTRDRTATTSGSGPPEGSPRREVNPILASPRTGIDRSGAAPWRPLTRRAFVAALGAAAAALAIRDRARERFARGDDAERPRSTWNGTTRWIGHC